MRVLLLGSGGREHAIFWKLSQSPDLTEIFVFPGNGGFPDNVIAKGINLNDFESIRSFVKANQIELIFVGPEQPLVDGITDALERDCLVFGPVQRAAMLEGSKEFSKSFMQKHGIPTAQAKSFNVSSEAIAYLKTRSLPIVIKADGLAAGKGVTVAQTFPDAEAAIVDALDKKIFGASGATVLVEDFLKGEEASVFAICDGERALPMIAAQDHKRVFDNDQGPNTGGMGAYAPVPFMQPDVMKRVQMEVLDRVVAGMKAEGSPYRGLLYAGLMVDNGVPSVVEFNCRFGDPETQALLRLLDEDLLHLAKQSAEGNLPDRPLRFAAGAVICIVLAAEGYPGDYRKNIPLPELKTVDSSGDIIFFHAGTAAQAGATVSTGGRVLNLTASGKDLAAARARAYAVLEKIQVPGLFYRKDIGLKGIL